jgi:hypothetical protein
MQLWNFASGYAFLASLTLGDSTIVLPPITLRRARAANQPF